MEGGHASPEDVHPRPPGGHFSGLSAEQFAMVLDRIAPPPPPPPPPSGLGNPGPLGLGKKGGRGGGGLLAGPGRPPKGAG